MFDQLKDMGKLMKKAKEMKGEMKKIQNELKDLKIVGKDNKGFVKVAVTGEMQCVAIDVDQQFLSDTINKKDVLEAALKEAFNRATEKAKETATSKLSVVSEGLNLPGM